MASTEQPPFLWYAGRARQSEIQMCPENLSTDIRMVLGILTACNRPSRQQIADATTHSLEWVARAVELLTNNSGHPTIRAILEQGLPLDAAVQFPEDRRIAVRCKCCKQSLASVPCAKCAIDRSFSLFRNITREKQQPEMPEAKTPTRSLPGTAGKVAIMRLRVEMGYSPFCRGDAELPQAQLAG